MKNRYIYSLLILLIIPAGCKSVKYVPIEKTKTDSIYFTDTVVNVVLKPFYKEKETIDTISHIESNYSTSEAKWSNGRLYHNIQDKDTVIEVIVKHQRTKTTIRVPEPYPVEKIVKVEKKLSKWQRFKMQTGGIVLLALVLLLAYKLIKSKVF